MKPSDGVHWEALAQAIKYKPESFQLWLLKQSIRVCATQKNTAQIQDILNDRCPNCGKWGEVNKHLNWCLDPEQLRLLWDGVRNLSKWMKRQNQTEPELAFWINQYLLHRGQVQMINLATPRPMSPAFGEVAESQDRIC